MSDNRADSLTRRSWKRGIVLAGALLGFVAMLLAGRALASAYTRMHERNEGMYRVGDRLPLGTMYDQNGAAVSLRTMVQEALPTVIILFNPNCGKCLGESVVWQELSTDGDAPKFIVVAITADTPAIGSFRERGLELDVFRGDPTLARSMRVAGSPTIHVIDSDGVVLFTAAGHRATSELESWLRSRKPLGATRKVRDSSNLDAIPT